MSLTWKDVITTLLAMGVVGIAITLIRGWDIPVIGNARLASLTLLIVGVAMCVLGAVPGQDLPAWYSGTMGVLAGLSVLLSVLGLIFGMAVYPAIAAIIILVMWVAATVRHMLW